MKTFLERSEIYKLQSNTYHKGENLVKIGQGDNLSQSIFK